MADRVVRMPEEGAGARGRSASAEVEGMRRSKKGLAALRARLLPEREALPIHGAREGLAEAARGSRALVVVGETGSGKTTQIPQLLLDRGLSFGRAVAVTQPRRVAAVTVAQRVADERGARLGGAEVGYRVRFDDRARPDTRLVFLTDGMLVREAAADPDLSRYGAIVLDEAHERTLHTDILFGLVKALMGRRQSDLRVVAMSATLQARAFSAFFFGAPTLYVSGRQHPVDVYYAQEPQCDYVDAAVVAALQINVDRPAPGDILVFLTGREEIEDARRMLEDRAARMAGGGGGGGGDVPRLVVAPMYAALPQEEQLRVFERTPPGHRKVVLATNIAETSVTIPGVRYVVDSGRVKQRAFRPRTGMEVLRVVPTSRAEAGQRAGRAGRVQAGECYRLYPEPELAAMPEHHPAEMLRCSLPGAVLQLMAAGVRDVRGFPFMDAPPKAALRHALRSLLALGAVKGGGLSAAGRRMAALPLEPAFSRALLAAREAGCGQEMLTVVAVMSADGSVFEEQRGSGGGGGRERRRRFASREGDHLTLLHVYRAYEEAGRDARWCRENGVSARTLRRAALVRRQLEQIVRREDGGAAPASCGADLEPVRRCLAAGLLLNVARLQPDGSYRTDAGSAEAHVHPSSVLMGVRPRPPCLVYTELVLTSKRYLRDVCVVEPGWVADGAGAAAALG